jgi:heme/copper-type cytochrome/quinol oxidase subunit 2
LVTVGAQLVIVISLVVYTVEVVHLGGALEPGAEAVTGELPLGPAGLEDPTGTLPVGIDPVGAVSVGEGPAGVVDCPAAGVVSVTGHTVVEIAMVEVTTVVESAGQLVTVGAQLVIVISLVVYTVEVVHLGGALEPGVIPAAGVVAAGIEGEGTPGTEEPTGLEAVGMEAVGTEATEDELLPGVGVGRAEVVPGVQSKPTL